MKTVSYNPSSLELEFANAILTLQEEINKNINSNQIVKIEKNGEEDNPSLVFFLEDHDGDKHEVVMRVIQRVDKHD
ncbi:hypothetical protein QQ020_05735 [Fulvivirgaceae bacterium BMA12]|uniref:Uncharacterized protein n=1 Tax=Agaribacillus aureus TaxID=3051825 RepID=A0ABT8L1H0_9BACT|nr:hypothetical protein [Fulvivirgaceae bacterium BMA12]